MTDINWKGRAEKLEAERDELQRDYAVIEGHLSACRARCERMRTMEGLPLDECAARQLLAEKQRDEAIARAEKAEGGGKA